MPGTAGSARGADGMVAGQAALKHTCHPGVQRGGRRCAVFLCDEFAVTAHTEGSQFCVVSLGSVSRGESVEAGLLAVSPLHLPHVDCGSDCHGLLVWSLGPGASQHLGICWSPWPPNLQHPEV